MQQPRLHAARLAEHPLEPRGAPGGGRVRPGLRSAARGRRRGLRCGGVAGGGAAAAAQHEAVAVGGEEGPHACDELPELLQGGLELLRLYVGKATASVKCAVLLVRGG